jgi:hypothetical protein
MLSLGNLNIHQAGDLSRDKAGWLTGNLIENGQSSHRARKDIDETNYQSWVRGI